MLMVIVNGDSTHSHNSNEMGDKAQFVFLTTNKNKQRVFEFVASKNPEFLELFKVSYQSVDTYEIQGSFEQVAIAKMESSLSNLNYNPDAVYMIEDTGMEIDVLGGFPGPYLKQFRKAMGEDWIVRMTEALMDQRAKMVCMIALRIPGRETELIKSMTEGYIDKAQGPPEYGMDTIFYPKSEKLPYALMTMEEKYGVCDRTKGYIKTIEYVLEELRKVKKSENQDL